MRLVTEGQVSDDQSAAVMLAQLPLIRELITDCRYDSDRLTALQALLPARTALQAHSITPCIPSTRSRKQPIPHNPALYRQRIEIMPGRLKDWRCIAMRDDQCAHTFFAAIMLAAIVTHWFRQ